MEWMEKQPLPECCRKCREADCYNCDRTGHRWSLSEKDTLRTRRKMLIRAIERLQKQVQELDELLKKYSE